MYGIRDMSIIIQSEHTRQLSTYCLTYIIQGLCYFKGWFFNSYFLVFLYPVGILIFSNRTALSILQTDSVTNNALFSVLEKWTPTHLLY